MRLIDKLKKKIVSKDVRFLASAQPLWLKTDDGKDIKVFFGGLYYVYDKPLHSALIEYQIDEKKKIKKQVLIEPVTREYSNGFIEDNTEKYFKQILDSANVFEDKEKYTALTRFFGMKETEEKELKSDYIGSLAQYENGTYYRFFDDEFRIQYVREKLDEKYLNY